MHALVPGSFDPVTSGHMDVIRRASRVFPKVTVVIAVNAAKTAWLSPQVRAEMVVAALQEARIDADVICFNGLIADLVADPDSTVIVKGVRGSRDLDSESVQAQVNNHLCGATTLLLPAMADTSSISSTMVRDLFEHGAPVGAYVPSVVASMLESHREIRSQDV